MVCLLISLVIAYIVGALPTGYLLCKLVTGTDIREYGSGNIGATNIARLLGIKYFALVFLIDAGKAWITLYGCNNFLLAGYNEDYRVIALLASAGMLLVGNAYSCFIRFRGGKGVATIIGLVAYLYPPFLVLLFFVSWLVVLAITRRAFMASLVTIAVVSATGITLYALDMRYFIFLIFMCVWLIVRHHGNIKKWRVVG